MIVSQIDLGRSAVGNASRLKVHHSHKVGFHGLLDPHGLTAGQGGHLLDVWEVKLALVRPVGGRKHVLLPRLSQQALDGDGTSWQAVGPRGLAPVRLVDPSAVHKDGGAAVLTLQRSDDHVAVLAVAHPGPDEHFLVVPEATGRVDAAIVKVVNGGRIDGGRQRKRVAHQAVFKLGDELRLPAEPLDLPGAQGEGGDGDQS